MRRVSGWLIVLFFAAVAPSPAAVIDSESFEPPFDLATAPAWTIRPGQEFSVNVVDNGLTYSRGAVSVDGGTRALEVGPGLPADIMDDVVAWDFPDITADDVWFSLLIQSSADASTSLPDVVEMRDFVQIYLSESGGQAQSLSVTMDNVGVADGDHAYQARAGASNNVNDPGDILNIPEETFLVVGHVEKVGAEYETISIFVNPGTPEAPATPTAMATFAGLTPTTLSQLNFRAAFLETDDAYLLDQLIVGESYEDVVAIDPNFLAGDFDDDGMLDEEDFDILADNLFAGTTYEEGDFNFDGIVDLRDFIEFRAAFNAAGLAAANVPEPGSLILLVIGGLLWLTVRRRPGVR